MFEIEVVQEIWRFEDLTLSVYFVTHDTAVIKGMKGKFSRDRFKEITTTLKERGFSVLLYERKRGGTFTNTTIHL